MAGEALQGLGALNDGKSAQMAGEYNAQVAEGNARYSLQKATEDERKQRVVSKKFIGDIRANYGASGVTSDSASVLDILQESSANAELDALTIRHEGSMKYTSFMNDARMERISGDNARKSGNLRAAGYLVKGGESAAKAAATAGAG